MARRFSGLAVALGLAASLAYYVLFVKDDLPERSSLALDWDAIRALAGPVEQGPQSIGSEVVARGRFFGWMICAGCGWGEVAMEFRTYALRYADGASVVIDAVHDEGRHAAMPMMGDYDAAAFARQTDALRRAERILLTHEHWDHASGLLALLRSEPHEKPGTGGNDPTTARDWRSRLVIPEAQRHSDAMREAGLLEADFEGLPATPDQPLRAIAPGVVAIAMPGHTPGSQVVYVRRSDGAELLFLGDIVWNARNLRERRAKSRLVSLVAGEDRRPLLEQIAYFAELASDARRGANESPQIHFVVAHDPEQNALLLEQGLLVAGLGD